MFATVWPAEKLIFEVAGKVVDCPGITDKYELAVVFVTVTFNITAVVFKGT